MLKKLRKKIEVYAPISGKSILMEEVNDEVFSQKLMGDGMAIIPDADKLFAPFSGEITMVSNTCHAICLRSFEGLEVMVHCGLDTVELLGKGFNAKVSEGDTVQQGDVLLELDETYLSDDNIDMTTPVIVINSDKFSIINKNENINISSGEVLLEVEENRR